MKRIVFAGLICALLGISSTAQAGVYATLVSCNGTSSVTGRFIYVGTYVYAGNYYKFTFANWCPQTVELE